MMAIQHGPVLAETGTSGPPRLTVRLSLPVIEILRMPRFRKEKPPFCDESCVLNRRRRAQQRERHADRKNTATERDKTERHDKRGNDESPLDTHERLMRLPVKKLAQIERARREAT